MNLSTLNLSLLVVAASLFAVLAIDDNREQARIAKAIERRPPLTALDPNAVRRIRLNNPGSADIELEKTGSGWQMLAPVRIAADLVQIADLVGLAARETHGSLDADAVRLTDLGLDPPRSTITLDDTAIAIGEIEPLKRSRYVRLAGDSTPDRRVRLVDDFPAEPFDGDFTDLVNKALLPFDAVITRLELPGVELTRDRAGGEWRARPASIGATPDAIERLVDAWHEVRAAATLPPLIEARQGGGADAAVVLGDGQRIAYRIVDKAGARFLQRLDVPVSYQFAPVDADRLLKLAAAASPEVSTPASAP